MRLRDDDSLINEELCESCEPRLEIGPALRKTGNLLRVGEREYYGGRARTEYQVYECLDCGKTWTEVEDSGLGGHGWFLHVGYVREGVSSTQSPKRLTYVAQATSSYQARPVASC